MNESTQQRILVGVSGSRASVAALHWAAEEAQRREARLTVVCAWDDSLRLAPYAEVSESHGAADAKAILRNGLAAAMRTALGSLPPAGLDAELAEGVAERVLIDRSATADLLVIGTARPHDGAGPSVGPVIRACLCRAACPVVVVSPGAGQQASLLPDDILRSRLSALTG
ncbi:MAG: universal stress protein [Streptosporangiaceae bacterium]|jgi:nucleotide-binding universal stress UspA family protein